MTVRAESSQINAKVERVSNFATYSKNCLSFGEHGAQKVSLCLVDQRIQLHIDIPLAGIPINAHSNGLRAQTAIPTRCMQEKAYFALATYV